MKNIGAILLTVVLLASGCGGGGGGAPAPPATVSGMAAAGSVISGMVYLKDSGATPKELSKQSSDGTFSFEVTGLTPPFMLKVVGAAAGSTPLYSLVGGQGTANVNPMTNLVVAAAAGSGDLAALYGAADRSGLAGVAGNLAQALAGIQATLKPLLQKYGVAAVDPIKDPYQANGSGLDGMLDLVHIDLASSGSVTITDSQAPPVTRNVATGFATHAVSGGATLDGAPFAGVTVTVLDAATGAVVYGSAQTAVDGSYLVGNLPQGSYSVSAAKAGYSFQQASAPVTIGSSDSAGPVFQSSKPFTVSGIVSSANHAGLAGVTVSVQRVGGTGVLSAVTDGNGGYRVSGLSSGGYTVTPSRTDVFDASAVTFTPPVQSVTLGDAGNYAFVDFAAGLAGYTVSGQVARLSGGAPMAGVTLRLTTKTNAGALQTGSDAIFSTVTDADGSYALRGIPTGYYALAAVLDGYAFALSAGPSLAASADNFKVDACDTEMDFTGRPISDATGGVRGF